MSAGPAFEIVTRPGCGLCDALDAELRAELARRGLAPAVTLVDVGSDPELERRYGWHVPVLRVGGAVLCAHRLDPERLDAALAGRPWEPLELR